MPVCPELQIRLPNSPGALAGLCRLLGDENVDIIALGLDTQGVLRMVVDNHVRALAVLRERHYAVQEGQAIVANVPDGPGGIAPALALLGSAGVNVEYAYGSGQQGRPSAVVIGVADPLRAATAAGL